MKKCFYLIVTLLCVSLSAAATPISRIKGKIVDAGTNKPLDFADVLLFKKGDSNPVFHALPDMDGSFGIADVKNGEYSLMIRLVGYDPPGYRAGIFIGCGRSGYDPYETS